MKPRYGSTARQRVAPRGVPVVWHQAYEVDIGPHVFPTRKYRLVKQRLLAEGTITDADILGPEPATDAQVGLVHTSGFLKKIQTDTLSPGERVTLEVPFSAALESAMWLCAGGSLLTARRALDCGVAVHLGGGFHHAFADHGEGFCLINDVAIALRVLLEEGTVGRAMVVDLDVHHGNGTAAIFAADPLVFTLSVHQEYNYPAWKPPSDLDVGLADGTGDAAYLAVLAEHLPTVVATHRPDLAFYLAGADPYEQDQLGGLGMTLAGLRRRDAFVLRVLREANVPVAIVLAGGYAIRPDDTVEIHCNTVRLAAERLAEGHA